MTTAWSAETAAVTKVTCLYVVRIVCFLSCQGRSLSKRSSKIYKCHLCEDVSSFTELSQYHQHVKVAHNPVDIESVLLIHDDESRKKSETPVTCLICLKRCNEIYCARKHIKSFHCLTWSWTWATNARTLTVVSNKCTGIDSREQQVHGHWQSWTTNARTLTVVSNKCTDNWQSWATNART